MVKLREKINESEEIFYESLGKEFKMERENGETPNGNKMNNRWVLRTKDGELLDFDTYRNDLAERWGFKFE